MNNYLSNAINQAGQAAANKQAELTPEQIEEMKKKKQGMFAKIRAMLGYSDSSEDMPK